MSESAGESPRSERGLKRVIGPWLLTLFIIGDLLGTGIYALPGEVADLVGGMVWLPFLLAVVVGMTTALSYLELVTKYPRAAGAALYVSKAFNVPFGTFMVGFAVVCSGITSSSTAARAFAANLSTAFDLGLGDGIGITLAGLAYIVAVAAINYRGVGESLVANVILTFIEVTGLLLIIGIGFMVVGQGGGDLSRALEFKQVGDNGTVMPIIAATTLAFFAMLGFEDAVNMVEETKDPSRIFPRALVLGLSLTALIYVLVSIAAIAVVPPETLAQGDTPLLTVVRVGAPGFPIWIFGVITMFAVANTGLLNMLMASRLLYGMSREGTLPGVLGKVHANRQTPYVAIALTTLLAALLITFVGAIPELAGTTTLLLMTVFTLVNIATLILRRDRVDHQHFRAPGMLPALGAITCAFLVGPWAGRDPDEYAIAGVLIAIGVALWFLNTWLKRRHS